MPNEYRVPARDPRGGESPDRACRSVGFREDVHRPGSGNHARHDGGGGHRTRLGVEVRGDQRLGVLHHRPTVVLAGVLVEALAAASTAGFGVVVVDSLSHYWMGVDGMLEQVDRRAKNGNNFSGWKEAGPDERRMIDALVAYPGHVIVTLRVKTEYVVEQNERGKSAPRKVGLKPIQRDGIEYEFDVVGELDLENTLTVTKSRIPTLSGAVVQQPGGELAGNDPGLACRG